MMTATECGELCQNGAHANCACDLPRGHSGDHSYITRYQSRGLMDEEDETRFKLQDALRDVEAWKKQNAMLRDRMEAAEREREEAREGAENERADHLDCDRKYMTKLSAAEARITLLEGLLRRALVGLDAFAVALMDGEDLHDDGCPEDDTCECRLVGLIRELLNDDSELRAALAPSEPSGDKQRRYCSQHDYWSDPVECEPCPECAK